MIPLSVTMRAAIQRLHSGDGTTCAILRLDPESHYLLPGTSKSNTPTGPPLHSEHHCSMQPAQ